MKQILLTPPVLTFPDFNKKFVLSTDASNYAAGAILSQKDEQGHLHPIAYASKPFSKTERSASISEKELAAVVFGVQHFSIYLLAKEFVLQTDHKGLSFLMKSNSPNAKLQRQDIPGKHYSWLHTNLLSSTSQESYTVMRMHLVGWRNQKVNRHMKTV